jgi:hypothetical protein
MVTAILFVDRINSERPPGPHVSVPEICNRTVVLDKIRPPRAGSQCDNAAEGILSRSRQEIVTCGPTSPRLEWRSVGSSCRRSWSGGSLGNPGGVLLRKLRFWVAAPSYAPTYRRQKPD